MKNIEDTILFKLCGVVFAILFVAGFIYVGTLISVNFNRLLIPFTSGIAKSRYEYQKEVNQAINGNEVKPVYETDKVICFEKYNVATNSSSLSCVNKEDWMKYRVEIDGYTKTTQYAIVEAESKEEAITIFNKGKLNYEYDFEDFEIAQQAEPIASEEE